jgi:hypothetical protein
VVSCLANRSSSYIINPQMVDAATDTVLLLQGGADLPPTKWRTRTLRRTPGSVQAALVIAGVKDKRKQPVLAVIVRGCGELQDEARRKEERRHQLVVMHSRLCMHKLLRTDVLMPRALPVVLEVQRGDISARGALGRRIEARIKEVVGEQGGQQAGSEGQRQLKPPKLAVKATERVKVSPCQYKSAGGSRSSEGAG